MAVKGASKGKASKGKSKASKADPPRAVLKDVLAVIESARSDISAEAREALIRAAGLMLNSRVEEALTEAAAKKSGSDANADMRLIHRALGQAITMIAWHGENDGAQHAKRFIRNMVKLAKKYDERDEKTSTHREAVLGALASLSHARTCDGRSVRFPNYDAIANAVLRKNRAQPDFEKQVSALAERLRARLAPYVDDNGYRPGVDLDDIATEACKAGGVDPNNALFAAEGMRKTRASRRRS